MYKFILTFAVGLALGAAAFFGFNQATTHYGNVITQGVIPKVTANAAVPVATTVTTLAATSSNCTGRIISTGSTTLMLSFGGLLNPTATVGNYQAGSTTVSYDNAVYGCGQITAVASAASIVTVTTLTQ